MSTDNSDVLALLDRARQAFEEGRFQESLQLYEKIRVLDPTNLEATINIGHLYVASRRYRSAVDLLIPLIFEHVRQIEIYYALVYALFFSDGLGKMMRIMNPAMKMFKHDARLRFLVAMCYKWSGRPKTAERLFTEAITLAPTIAQFPQELGKMYLELGRFKKAVKPLQQSFDLDPQPETAALLKYALQDAAPWINLLQSRRTLTAP